MNVDALKKQASRLAAYLGAHHRLKVKHSSALEAIAAAHGARNWATLAAQGGPAPETEAPQPSVRGEASGRQEVFPLAWQDGAPRLQVSRADWSRHTLAYGDPLEVRSWLGAHLFNCLNQSWSGVFFNTLADSAMPAITNLRESPAPAQYNLLGGLSLNEACDTLMQVYPRDPSSELNDWDRSRCNLALRTVLPQAGGLTLRSVLTALEPAALRLLMQSDAQVAGELGLHAAVPQGGKADEVLAYLVRLFKPLTSQLHALLQTEEGSAILADTSEGALSVVDCAARGDLIHVSLPTRGRNAECLRKLWMAVMPMAAKRAAQTGAPATRPFVLGISEADSYVGRELAALAQQGRAFNTVLLLGSRLNQGDHGRTISQNVYNRVSLGAPTREEMRLLVLELENSTAQLRSPAGVSFY